MLRGNPYTDPAGGSCHKSSRSFGRGSEVAVTRNLFAAILDRIAQLTLPPPRRIALGLKW